MTLPAVDSLCRALAEFPDDLPIRFPGGAELRAQLEGMPPSLLGLARTTLGQANAALTPLTPIFDLIEALVAVTNCVKAIPDALGPPPDPRKMIDCIPTLVEKIEKLIALLPPVSVFKTIVDLLDVLIAVMRGTLDELRAVIRLIDRITRAEAMVGEVRSLEAVINCGQRTRDASMNNIGRALGAMSSILALLNGLTSLAGLQAVPSLEGGLPGDPEAAIDVLETFVDVLIDFRSTIPVS